MHKKKSKAVEKYNKELTVSLHEEKKSKWKNKKDT